MTMDVTDSLHIDVPPFWFPVAGRSRFCYLLDVATDMPLSQGNHGSKMPVTSYSISHYCAGVGQTGLKRVGSEV